MTRPRVLISYFFGDKKIPLGASCARALRELGCEVHCFDSAINSPWDRYFFRVCHKLIWAFGLRSIDFTKGSRFSDTRYRESRLTAAVEDFGRKS